ncbi:hypothetical protein [Absidia glauca]|uniref:Ndc10 domain-containing protein n=1 Tax=Absidia glauca TaxID=4829 RepID=A0A168RQW7_ABSGL|nr:hypothetical protein [Absidia glauca]
MKPSPWIQLIRQDLWQRFSTATPSPPIKPFLNQYLAANHAERSRSSVLLQQCRPRRGIDPIMVTPMLNIHRSRLIPWRLGWLTGGTPKPCLCGTTISKQHIINCLRLHPRLSVPRHIQDPLSYLLNRFPRRPRSHFHHCQMEAALADHAGRIADPGTATTPRACRTSTCSRGSLPGLARPKSRPPLPPRIPLSR